MGETMSRSWPLGKAAASVTGTTGQVATPVPTGPMGPITGAVSGQAGTIGGSVKAGRGKNEFPCLGAIVGKTVVVVAGAKILAPVGSIAGTRTLAQPVSQAHTVNPMTVFLVVAEIHMRNRGPRGDEKKPFAKT